MFIGRFTVGRFDKCSQKILNFHHLHIRKNLVGWRYQPLPTFLNYLRDIRETKVSDCGRSCTIRTVKAIRYNLMAHDA